MKRWLLLSLLLAAARPGQAQQLTAEQTAEVSFEQKLGAALPSTARFTDETGHRDEFRHWFRERPVVLVFAWWDCPALCHVVLGSAVEGLRTVRAEVGRDFEVIVLSIDPAGTVARAAEAKKKYALRYGRHGSEGGWHFLQGEAASIQAVTAAAGFHYVREPVSGEYAHPSGLLILTPEGRVSKYLLGVEFPGKELQAALTEARGGGIGTRVRELLLLCFREGAPGGRYGRAIQWGLRSAGVGTVLGLAGGIFLLQRRKGGRSV